MRGVHIDYEGGPRGLHMLTDALRAEGVEVRYEPPVEGRGVGDEVHRVVVWLVETGRDQAALYALGTTARRVIAKLRERNPHLDAELRDDDD